MNNIQNVHSAGFVISTIKGNKRQQQTMCFWMHISRWTDLQRDENKKKST